MESVEQRLCVSVAAANLEELSEKVKRARALRPGFIEFRLDYLRERLDETGTLSKIRRLQRGNEIITLRNNAEGGRFAGNEKSRISLIRTLLHHLDPAFVDVEIQALRSDGKLAREVEESGWRLIASHHDLGNSPDQEQLLGILSGALNSLAFAMKKLVCKASIFSDNVTMLSLYDSSLVKRSVNPRKLIAFCVGELGVYSRIECLAHGSPMSYASLPGEAVAPGQLDFNTMKGALLLKEKGKTDR